MAPTSGTLRRTGPGDRHRRSRLGVIFSVFSLLAIVAGIMAAPTASATETTPVHVKASTLTDHANDCTTNVGAHFVITQIGEAAPSSISVVLDKGGTVTVPLEKISGRTAHYTVSFADGDSVKDATANLPADWTGQFNLSNYNCGQENPPPPAQCEDGSNPGDLNHDGTADSKDCGYVPPPESCYTGHPTVTVTATEVKVTGAEPGTWLSNFDAQVHSHQTKLSDQQVGEDCMAVVPVPPSQCKPHDYQWDLTEGQQAATIDDTNGDGVADVTGYIQGMIYTVPGDDSLCETPPPPYQCPAGKTWSDKNGDHVVTPDECMTPPPPYVCPPGTTWMDSNGNHVVDMGECKTPPPPPGYHCPADTTWHDTNGDHMATSDECMTPPPPVHRTKVYGAVKKLDKCGMHNFVYAKKVMGAHYVNLANGKTIREGVWVQIKRPVVRIRLVADSHKYVVAGTPRFVVKFPNMRSCSTPTAPAPHTGL